MTNGNEIDAFVKHHSRAMGAPLYVSPNVIEAMKRDAANVRGLMRDGYLRVTIDQPCPRCGGRSWLCEAHPDEPFEHDGCPGPGDPCPDCNELARK